MTSDYNNIIIIPHQPLIKSYSKILPQGRHISRRITPRSPACPRCRTSPCSILGTGTLSRRAPTKTRHLDVLRHVWVIFVLNKHLVPCKKKTRNLEKTLNKDKQIHQVGLYLSSWVGLYFSLLIKSDQSIFIPIILQRNYIYLLVIQHKYEKSPCYSCKNHVQ